ncbi:MAG: zinc-regulated TonB-dependent outer membrane receptor [Methylotenera sp.]|nr:zinc-regulated TonB-dependent outer membrane receptor [Oligoflexia bacterium]
MKTFLSLFVAIAAFSSLNCVAQDTVNGADQASNGGASTGSSGVQSMNPDLSLDGLFNFSQFSNGDPLTFDGGHDPKQNGFGIQQVEATFGSFVDPYFRADANLVFLKEKGQTKIEIEEAYATSTALPADLQLKVGQFFNAFGRNNPVHPHAWDYVNKPLVLGRMFGGDGLRNTGVQVSWLSPLPWFSELTLSAQNSTGDTAVSFRSGTNDQMRAASDLLGLAKWNNFFGLSEMLSLNVGASYLKGPNSSPGKRSNTQIVGGDVFLKYRNPSSLSYVSLQAEVLKRYFRNTDETLQDQGAYVQLSYRVREPFERWVAGLRYDWVGARAVGSPNTSPDDQTPAGDRDLSRRFRLSPVVTFFPSEFSKLRAQYDYDRPDRFGKAQQVVTLQLEFVMGAHGAHKF